jgi:3-hydroxy-3-methylglutaryl CoA synthase
MNVGIQHLEVYLPGLRVAKRDAVPFSKYPLSEGDEAESLTVLPSDEDVISMALTVVRDLMERTGIGWDSVGMIQVGTSTNVDRTKPIHSYISAMFNARGVHDIIGGDNTFACNAGMNALMHVASWMGSPLWNGKLGLVVTADFSHTATAIRHPYDRVWNGAAACAAVIAPHAALGIESFESRTCHNFSSIRPTSSAPYRSCPDAGGAESFERFYDRELTLVVQSWKRNRHVASIAEAFDHFAIHDITPSRVRRSFRTVMEADGAEAEDHLGKLLPSLAFFRHTQHVGVSNVLLYLAGIVDAESGRGSSDSRVFCLGEGSGFQTSILTLRGDPGAVSLNDVWQRLGRSVPLTWWEYHDLCETHLDLYGRPRPWAPTPEPAAESSPPVRIASVDRTHKRRYEGLTADSGDQVKWPGALFNAIAGALLIFDVPLLIGPMILLWQCDVSRPAGWVEALNLVSAASTLAWRALALVVPDSLYPEIACATSFVQRRYRLNLRSFSFFAAAACLWTLAHPDDPITTALWLSYFAFRQLNLAVTLHCIEPLLFLHDALLVVGYLVAMQAGLGVVVAAVLGSLVVGAWRSISRAVLSWTSRGRRAGIPAE